MTFEPTDLRLVGHSVWSSSARRQIVDLASGDQDVLIVGPQSTGRRFLSRLIHLNSTRRSAPFVPVRCEFLSDELFCTQFFGVGSVDDLSNKTVTRGAARSADEGTIYLGNVDHLDVLSQWELLRFLTTRMSRPVGSGQEFPCNVRVIASCTSEVYEKMAFGQFDGELFERLAGTTLHAKGLEERISDVCSLAQHFLDARSRRLGFAEKVLEPSAREWLRRQSWPGNVGQLRQFMHQLAESISVNSIDHEAIQLWIAAQQGRLSFPG